jgi:hypothetical protein
MFKRNDPKPKSSRRRNRLERAKRNRRMVMEGLEDRRLLAGLGNPSGVVLPTYSGPRNIGTVQAVNVVESELSNQFGLNDSLFNADLINLGTGPGQDDTIDLIGNIGFVASQTFPPSFTADIDSFAFDLRAGDILDVAVQGAAGEYTVFNPDGSFWYGVDGIQSFGYPADSPLQNNGNAAYAQVVPEDGRYFVTLAPVTTGTSYTVGLRAYRPSIESTPIGTQQIMYVDFDGGYYQNGIYDDGSGIPQPGIVRIPGLRESLPLLGIQNIDDAAYNRIIDLTMAETKRMYGALGVNGSAGDFVNTGIPGDFGITILNSRDDPDPGNSDPLVTRVLIGGTSADSEGTVNPFGRSSTIDIGNFSMDDTVVGLLEGVLATVAAIPTSPNSSIVDVLGDFLAFLVTHEAGHSFGMRHTGTLMSPAPFPPNLTANIMDEGPPDFGQILGLGGDGIFGTPDDIDVNFVTDIYSYNEGLFGFNQTAKSLSNTLLTGTQGGGISGRVFNDVNSDGNGTGDFGIDGVRVYADINNDGTRQASEPTAVTAGGGNYMLIATPGTYNVVAETPSLLSPTTPTSVLVSIASGGSGVANFGFSQLAGGGITGTTFSDNNSNGNRESSEDGVAGIYHYLDLDGDNRADLGEPSSISDAAGAYRINFPGAGNYTIRQVVPAGFTQTSPVGGEHNVNFDGIALTQSYDFGLLASRDFGDAPDSYGTTLSADGASHGITAGLNIGATVDRELDGQPTTSADGDDLNGRILISGATEDDEDGVTLLQPLGPGARADFSVNVTNTSGAAAYLQGFMDFNADGDFTDPGEQFLTNVLVPNGSVGLDLDGSDGVFVDVPLDATVGTTFARFRLSQATGLGPLGAANTGEVEDYRFPILGSAEIANDDLFSVPRNSQANQLDVLANDFETADNQLTIQNLNTTGTAGVAILSGDRRSVFYTPPNGFIGRDAFSYTVFDEFGNTSTATSVINVTFQSAVPIAVDDTFEIPQGSVNRPLNVLDNDLPSTSGGLSIISVTPGTAGGTISIVGGGQSLRYTPLPGFNGTEQFTYSVQDPAGLTSSAQVTVNLLPGSRADDIVDFSIGIFDAVNQQQEITDVQVGDVFLVRVSVDHIELFANPEGVASAFLDLLYTDELVATTNTGINPDFQFDITFGELFSGINTLQRGSSQTPGLIDEVGGVQRIDDLQPFSGQAELFTVRMQALSPGVAQFVGDPADNPISETITLGSDTALTVSQLRLGTAQLIISPDGADFTAAIDDSYPDGRDSDGNLISSASQGRNRLDVLANDNLGPTGLVREFGLVTSPALGNVLIEDNGTPGNLNDDFFSYSPNVNANGLEQFRYFIVTDDGIRSTAEVTIPLGATNANADVSISYNLVNENGQDIINSQVNVGDRIGVQVIVEDVRSNPSFVFAGFLDMMYDTGVLIPSDTDQSDNLDFDVVFGPDYVASAASGTAARPGIIDEFGTLFERASVPDDEIPGLNPGLLATVFFVAVAPGQTSVVGGPADSSPFQDTLLFGEDDPVPVSKIRYDVLDITVNSGGPAQNSALPQDVNDDGFVTPIDALLVINEMSRVDPVFEGESGAVVASQFFTDVNGDERVSALDALQVINYLTVQHNQQGGEGELIATSDSATGTDLQSSADADAVFADLGESSLVGDAAASSDSGNVAVAALASPSVSNAADDDEDDILSLLADDVSGLWS